VYLTWEFLYDALESAKRGILVKILLIKPPLNRYLFAPAIGEPLELEYLAAAVKEHDVQILDMRIEKNLVDKLEKFNPDFVGITGYTCDVNSAKDVLKEVKKFDTNIVTAIGGHHATFMPYDCAMPYVDVMFFGMSDLSFKEYSDALEAGEEVYSIKNIAFRNGDEYKFTEQADFDVELDSLPLPARHLTRHYWKHYRDQRRNRTAFVLTSRGCPYRCTFCACWKLMQGKYITRNPEFVVEELALLPEDVKLVCFADDNSLHSIRRAWRLSELIQQRGINKKLSMYARVDTIVKHPDLIESLKVAGLDHLTLGLEAIKDEELDAFNKKTSVEKNNEAIRILQKLDVTNLAHFIVNPDFTEEDFNQLFKYICDMDLYQPVFTVLTPLPGTELYQNSCNRLAIKNYDFFDHAHSVLPTKLDRREFYSQFVRLYAKSYSYRRYFKSVWKDIHSKLNLSKGAVHYRGDRLSLIRLILMHIFVYPLKNKMRNMYRSEPLVESFDRK
jgi:radical SAM superfamily enzyme YgiQ (UPF0313 family)